MRPFAIIRRKISSIGADVVISMWKRGRSRPATEVAFRGKNRTTLVGSIIPDATWFAYDSIWKFKQKLSLASRILPKITEPLQPALSQECESCQVCRRHGGRAVRLILGREKDGRKGRYQAAVVAVIFDNYC